jgi:O-antigen polysaccharide polymerase Wzy
MLRLDPLSPAMIYFYLLGLFHLGLVVPWALGVAASEPPPWLITNDLNPALAIVIVAITSYHAGAAMAVWLWPPEPDPASNVRSYNSVLCAAGLAIVGLGLLAFCAGIQSLGLERLLRSDYAETYTLASHYDPRLFATSMTFVPLGLYLAAASARRAILPWVLGCGIAWGGCILFLGFRGYALVPAITILAVLHKRGIRLPRLAYLVGLPLVLAAIPFIRAARAQRLADRGVATELTVQAPLLALEEMGGSLRALVHTIQFLDNEPLRWGQTYWLALRSAVPNVALHWEGGEYLPVEQLPPSHWLTLQAAPEAYRAHGGLGFSAVAEPYMNFGAPGVAAYFFLLAMLLVAAYRFDFSRPTRLALWAVVLGPLLWTVRNDFHGFFRPVVLGLAGIAAAHLLASSRTAGLAGGAARDSSRIANSTRPAGVHIAATRTPTTGTAFRP